MRVVVGPHAQGQALVQRAAGEPVQLGGAGLEDRHAAVGGQLDRLVDPLVAGDPAPKSSDVQRGRGHPGAQRLDHRVAAGHELGRVPRAARGPPGARGGRGRAVPGPVSEATRAGTRAVPGRVSRAPGSGTVPGRVSRAPGSGTVPGGVSGAAGAGAGPGGVSGAPRAGAGPGGVSRAAGAGAGPGGVRRAAGAGAGGALLGGVAGALGGGRGRALALKLAAALAAGAGARLAGLGAARATAAFAARRRSAAGPGAFGGAQRFSSQRGPCGVSSTMTPISSRPSRIASAVA